MKTNTQRIVLRQLVGNIRKAMFREARIIAASLKIKKIPPQIPSALNVADFGGDLTKWLDACRKYILKEAGIKGRSGAVKKMRTFISVAMGPNLPIIYVSGVDSYMVSTSLSTVRPVDGLTTPAQVYAAMVNLCQNIPAFAYAKEVADLFQKTTGLGFNTYLFTKGTESATLQMRGSDNSTNLDGLVSSSGQQEWTLEWKGQKHTDSDFESLLDVIDEESDSMMPIFQSTSKLKKLMNTMASNFKLDAQKAVGFEAYFGDKFKGISTPHTIEIGTLYSGSTDEWFVAIKALDFVHNSGDRADIEKDLSSILDQAYKPNHLMTVRRGDGKYRAFYKNPRTFLKVKTLDKAYQFVEELYNLIKNKAV